MGKRFAMSSKVVVAGLLAVAAAVPASQAFADKGNQDGPKADPGVSRPITYDSAGMTSRPITARRHADDRCRARAYARGVAVFVHRRH